MNGTSAYGAAKNYTDEHGGGGDGNVNSVNGKKGNVLLNASDIKDKNGKTVEDRLSDVVDNLITNDPSKPISARQGKNLQDNKADKSEAVQFTLIPLTEPKTREEIRNLYASSAYKFRMMTTCFTNDDSPTGSSASVFVVNVYGAGKRIILKATLTNISTGVSMGDEWTCLYKGTGSPDQWEPWIKTIDISKGFLYKSDIIDNLVSTDINKPLSANQGKNLQDNKKEKTSIFYTVASKLNRNSLFTNLDIKSGETREIYLNGLPNLDPAPGFNSGYAVLYEHPSNANYRMITIYSSTTEDLVVSRRVNGVWSDWIQISKKLFNHIIVLQGGKPEIKAGLQIIDAKQTDLTINEILLFIKNNMTSNDIDATENNKTYAAWGTVNESGGKYPVSGIYYSSDRNITCVVFNYTKFLDDEHTKITNEPTICPFAANPATIITQSTIELK